MLWKCCTQYASKFGKLSSGHRTGKGQFSFQSLRKTMPKNALIPKKDNAKECSNYHTIALISHTSKVMLKILQARLQQYMNHELPDVQAGFRKGRGTRDQIANICWIIAKSLQLCPTQCEPIDGSPPGSAIPGILQERTLEWVAISFSNAGKWKVKVNSLSRVRVRLVATPWTAAYQAPPSMGFSRQKYWSGVPLPSPLFL